jgi:hypothetical protein
MPTPTAILHIGVPPRPISPAYAALLDGRAVAGEWLVQAPTIGLKLAASYNPDGTWEDRLLSLGDIEVRVPPGGGIATVANVTLHIVETGTGQSLVQRWEATGTVNGVMVTIEFLGAGEGTALRLFTGVIDSITVRDAVSEVLVVDSSIQKNVLLPQQVLDQTTVPLANPHVWGHRAPLVYGQGSRGGKLPLQSINIPGKTFLVAGHPLTASGTVAVFAPDTAKYLGLTSSSQLQITAGVSATTLTLPNPPQELRFNVQLLPQTILAAQGVTNPLYAIDRVSTTLALISTSALDSNLDGIGQLMVGTVASEDQRGNNTVVIDFTTHRRALASDPTVTGLFTVRTMDPARGITLRDNLLQTPPFRHSLNPQTASFVIPSLNLGGDEQLVARVVARHEGGVGNANQYYEIGDIAIESYYQPAGDITLYLTGSAWAGRTDPDGTVTAYYAVPGAGHLLTQPDQIIASLLIQELGLTVDPGWFALAYTWYASQAWHYDGGIGAGWAVEAQPVRQVLGDLAQQAGGLLVPTFTGAWGLRSYRTDVPAVLAFDIDTILCVDGTSPATPGEQRRSSLVMTLGDLQQVANRFEVRYAYNPGSQTYDKAAIVDRAGCTVGGGLIATQPLFLACLSSYTNYGLLEPRTIDAYWIQDDHTAALLLQHLVLYSFAQRLTVVFDTTLRALQLQVGDFIQLTYPLLPLSENGQTFEVHALRYAPMTGRVSITASRSTVIGFEFLALQDQNHVVWYWWVNQAGELTRDTTAPVVAPFTTTVLFPNEAPQWLRLYDTAGAVWFLSPNTFGELTSYTTPPVGGSGRESGTGVVVRGVDQRSYRFGVNTLGEVLLSPP